MEGEARSYPHRSGGPVAASEPVHEVDRVVVGRGIARNSLYRFAGEGIWAFSGLLTGLITARHLGPAGKGTLSVLSYLVALFTPFAAFGLGEASITLVGTKGYKLRQVVPATIAVLVPSLVLGIGCLFVACLLTFGHFSSQIPRSITAALIVLPLATGASVFGSFVESQQRIRLSSVVRAGIGMSTTFATFVLVDLWPHAITGALAASGIGFGLGLAILVIFLRHLGVPLLPRWDRSYMARALRIGIPVQVALLVLGASARVDLLILNGLRGAGSAGQYSIALTLGQLPAYAAIALMIASYPRLAAMSRAGAADLVLQASRTSLVSTLVLAAGVAVVVPIVLTPLFGEAFRPAIGPAEILVLGSLPWSVQWTLCRGVAARGRTSVLTASFAVSFVVMVALDYAFIPLLGASGAAVAADLASVAGAVAAWFGFLREAPRSPARALIPGKRELHQLASIRGMLFPSGSDR